MMLPLRSVTLFLLPSSRMSLCQSTSRDVYVSQLIPASHPPFSIPPMFCFCELTKPWLGGSGTLVIASFVFW